MDAESGAREVNALLRLVLSMGGARGTRSHLMYDDHSPNQPLSDDEEVTSSESESSESSQSDDLKAMEAENVVSEPDNLNVESSSGKSTEKPLESKTKPRKPYKKVNESSDESEFSKPSSSKSSLESNTNNTNTKNNVDSKKNGFDSGIAADNGWETSSSLCETSDQTDTNSSIDNISDTPPRSNKKGK